MTRLEKLTVLLGIIFFCLLNYPLLAIFNSATLIGGLPAVFLYLFAIWLLAIIWLGFCGWRSKSRF